MNEPSQIAKAQTAIATAQAASLELRNAAIATVDEHVKKLDAERASQAATRSANDHTDPTGG